MATLSYIVAALPRRQELLDFFQHLDFPRGMKTVKIRERKGEFQVYEKESGAIVFRGSTEDECFDFLANQRKFSYQETEEKGIHYVY